MVTLVLFIAFAIIALVGALGVVISRNPVHSALWLVATLLSMAGFFILEGAYLVSAVQVIVYASAIVVLFLFVIMLLGVDREESLSDTLKVQRPVALMLGLVVFALLIGLMGNHWATGAQSATAALESGDGGNVERAGEIFTTYLWPFELTSALLVVAVVGGSACSTLAQSRGSERGGPVIITPTWYLVLAAALFAIGAVGMLVRRNVIVMFMCVELMLNAVNLTFVTFSQTLNDLSGQVAVFFVLVVAAAEVAIGLALIVAIFRRRHTGTTADDISELRG